MRTHGTIGLVDLAPPQERFRDAVLHGLSQPEKRIPCKFLYDERGSQLFDEICELPEYYPTRTEIGILTRHGGEMAAFAGPHCQLVEFGSGSSRKVRILLEHLDRPAGYVPVDISREHLIGAASALAGDYPDLEVTAVCADYTRRFPLPPSPDGRRIGFFPGSTIGNFSPAEVREFLGGCARMLSGGGLLIGVDLKKEPRLLHAAYNDSLGVTADFNLNLLVRINRELDGDFDLDGFRHLAFYNSRDGRIEIYIESLREQSACIDGTRIEFAEGECIHTEYSYKFSVEEFQEIAGAAGFVPRTVWCDPQARFSVHYLEAPGRPS